jgi:hypothetical protein
MTFIITIILRLSLKVYLLFLLEYKALFSNYFLLIQSFMRDYFPSVIKATSKFLYFLIFCIENIKLQFSIFSFLHNNFIENLHSQTLILYLVPRDSVLADSVHELAITNTTF